MQKELKKNMGVMSAMAIVVGSVITMRRKHPELKREYKVPGYPVIPVLAILSGLYVIFSQLFLSGSNGRIMALASVGITLIGLPVYLLVKRNKA